MTDPTPSRSRRAAPWVEGGVLAVLVLAIYVIGGEALRASYHGYLHATIGEAVLRDGLLPENPYHAGTDLRYYTLYPALGAILGRTGIGPLWALALLNVLAALLLGPSLDALGRSMGLGFAARRATFVAAVLGFNGLGWIGLVVTDSLLGPGDVGAPVFALMPTTFAREPFGWDARLQAFLPKYLNASSYALALPFALWALARAGIAQAATPHPVRAIVPAALALALNPLAGAFAGAVLAIWTIPPIFRASGKERLAWPLAGAVAVLCALPFLLGVLQPSTGVESLTGEPALGGSPLANWLGPLAILIPTGLLGVRSLEPGVRWRWAAAAALCAIIVLVGEMPHGNEYKLARLGAVVWALAAGAWAGAAFARGGVVRALPILVALACVPTTLVAIDAYVTWGRATTPPLLQTSLGRLAPDPTRAEHPLLQPILDAERASPENAVVVMHLLHPGTRLGHGLVQGNALAPALTHPLFVDLPQIHNDGLPDLDARLRLVSAAFGGLGWEAEPRPPCDALIAIRATLPTRSWIVIAHDSELAVAECLRSQGATPAAGAGGFTLWRWNSVAVPTEDDG